MAIYPPKEPQISPAAFAQAGPEALEMQPVLYALVREHLNKDHNDKLSELPSFRAVRAQDVAYQGRVVLGLTALVRQCLKKHATSEVGTMGELLAALLRGTLALSDAECLRLFELYGFDRKAPDAMVRMWPFPLIITLGQVERLAKKRGLGPDMHRFLTQLLVHTVGAVGDAAKARLKAQDILNLPAGSGGATAAPTIAFDGTDSFGQHLNAFVASLGPDGAPWLRLLQAWQKADGSRPTPKLRQELDAALAALEPAAVQAQVNAGLAVLAAAPVRTEISTHTEPNGTTFESHNQYYIGPANLMVAKGLVWSLATPADAATVRLLAKVAARGLTPTSYGGGMAISLGNACVKALAESGLPGLVALLNIPKVQSLDVVRGAIRSLTQELGLSPMQLADLQNSDCGLHEGRAETDVDDCTATLALVAGKVELRWSRAGQPLKAPPAALKATHAAALRELKDTQAQAQRVYSAQRERLDRSFTEAERRPWPQFEASFFAHGLLGQLVRPLIWRLHRPDGTHHDALWATSHWHDALGRPVAPPTATTEVQLWHPLLGPPAEVLAWRAWLEKIELRQPFKQAFREVYLLTPPEERTRTYSNRMAAHLLRQPQLAALAAGRGWYYEPRRLHDARRLGAAPAGHGTTAASRSLPAHGLEAEFWVSQVEADGAWTTSGTWHYVSTDQLRFTRADEPVPLPEIAPLVFSEVMRDADLFVGVASVGNDPAWRDGGELPQYRTHWEHYSFGELGEVAKSRRLALERLVPHLKIGKVSELTDKFLVVRGKVRTYKIHLGSGNILMEPNDQYLCIVPDRSAKTLTADVFLPFEGDAVLSIILSKALLLMDDDKITDTTIVRQIRLLPTGAPVVD